MEKSLARSQPLTCFVLELVSSGYFGDQIGPSFRAEGRAMLDAVLNDLRCILGVAAETIEADESHGDTLRQRVAAHRAHATLIIAPEFDGLIEEFCCAASRPGVTSLNCDPAALALCSDKWRLAQHLAAHQIPTIPSQLLNLEAEPECFPCVVKPRDGAGSWLVRLIRSPEGWRHAAADFRAAGRTESLCQPYIVGKSYSVAAIMRAGHSPELLPIAEQRLSDDGEFRYLGGAIRKQPMRGGDRTSIDNCFVPSPPPRGRGRGRGGLLFDDAAGQPPHPAFGHLLPQGGGEGTISWRIQQLVTNCLSTIPGLNGYVGCDVIVPADRLETPLLVEINPRITTSYIGYRRLCVDNILERLLFPARLDRPLRWRTGAVLFDAGGRCDYAEQIVPGVADAGL